jgi:hypothetical protein
MGFSGPCFTGVALLQSVRLTKIFSSGRSSAAFFTDKLWVTNVFFIFFEFIFYETDIFSHAKMSLVARMRLA